MSAPDLLPVSDAVWDIVVVLVFILIGGVFNAAEVAMISLRESQVEHLAATRGRNGQRLEKLVSDPDPVPGRGADRRHRRDDAVVRVRRGDRLARTSRRGWSSMGMEPTVAEPVALVGVTLIISFCSLVLGELTPKRLGLQRSEAHRAGRRPGRCPCWPGCSGRWSGCWDGRPTCSSGCSAAIPKARGEVMGQDELRSLVLAHESLTSVERRMIVDVFDAETTRVREVMVPRPDVEFLPASMSLSRAARTALAHPHSRYPGDRARLRRGGRRGAPAGSAGARAIRSAGPPASATSAIR